MCNKLACQTPDRLLQSSLRAALWVFHGFAYNSSEGRSQGNVIGCVQQRPLDVKNDAYCPFKASM